MDRMLALHAGSRGFDSQRGHMSERFFRSNRPGYPHPVSSELENSGIRVAIGDCSVTERRRWRPPYQTGKTVNVHAKLYKHNEDGRTALGVCGNGSVPLSHSGNVVTRIGIHTHTPYTPWGVIMNDKPNQPGNFKFPKRSFGQKNPELRAFNPQWFTQRPWLHYDEIFIIQTVFPIYIFLTHWTRISLSTGVRDFSIPACCLSL